MRYMQIRNFNKILFSHRFGKFVIKAAISSFTIGNRESYFFWIMTNGSAIQSLMSMVRRFSSTSGRSLTMSQPKCEKNNPRPALCGSACVSWYLWWTRWSCTHTHIPNQMKWNFEKFVDQVCFYRILVKFWAKNRHKNSTILMSNSIEEC